MTVLRSGVTVHGGLFNARRWAAALVGGLCTVWLAGCSTRGSADPGAAPPAGREPAPGAANGEAEGGGAFPPPPVAVEPDPLPQIPRVAGPLEPAVQYPGRLQRITVRDSNFIFGAVGSGDAELTVDGVPVRVEANGAYLAWLPVPEPARGDTAEYLIVARLGAEVDTLRHRVLLPREPFVGEPGTVWLDTASLPTRVERWLTPEDPLEFAVRAEAGLAVTVEAEGERTALREVGEGVYRGTLRAGSMVAARCASGRGGSGGGEPCFDPERIDTLEVVITAGDGSSQRVERRRYPVAALDPEALPVVELREERDAEHGTSGVVPGRPTPYGTYRWLFPVGSLGRADLRVGDRVRLRLAPELVAWVAADHIEVVERRGAPEARVGWIESGVRPTSAVAVRIPLNVPVPANVEEPDEHTLRLTLYGALGETERMSYGESAGPDSATVECLSWAQRPGGLYELTLRLRRPVWGYRLSYWPTGNGGTELLLEASPAPAVDPAAPLEGRRVAVDAGHPPVGAFGPTGYYEGDANLAIAARLVELLREAGAEPIMIRSDTLPMKLYDRTGAAERAGAEVFVSIHNNALPDGVRPYGEEGTSTFYYHPHSRRLAEAVQAGLVGAMGLRDLGILWGSFAVTRLAWMPSVLAEGAFMMMPRHEAALRTPQFQEAYARGVRDGIEAFLRNHAAP